MMEALVCHPLGKLCCPDLRSKILIGYRHDQSPNAIVKTSTRARSMSLPSSSPSLRDNIDPQGILG